MPRFFYSTRSFDWFDPVPGWLAAGEAEADILSDFRTKKNQLSVWHIEDGDANLDRIRGAFAASRDQLTNLDYVLFDGALLAAIGIAPVKGDGITPDENANKTWHYNLKNLTANMLSAIACAVRHHGLPDRRWSHQVGASIVNSVTNGWVKQRRIAAPIRGALGL